MDAVPFRRGLLPLPEALPLGLDLWLLEDLRWFFSVRSFWAELRLASPLSSRLCCLSLRDFPERPLSLLRDEEEEEVVLPTLAAGCTWEVGGNSPRFGPGSASSCPWRRDPEATDATEATFSLFLPELPLSLSLLLFFL